MDFLKAKLQISIQDSVLFTESGNISACNNASYFIVK